MQGEGPACSDIRIVLVGKSGAGKSASGNTILGRDAFRAEASPVPVTVITEKQCGEVAGRQISVIDTPGIFFSSRTEHQIQKEITESISLSFPGPHVFLLVIRLGIFHQEEREAVQWIMKKLGEEASKHTMVLFTCADLIKTKSVKKFLDPCYDIQQLIRRCGGGYHVFNNEDKTNHTQVPELLEKIETMVKRNGGQYYSEEMYWKADRMNREEEERKKREEVKKKKQEEEKIRADEERKWKEAERKTREEEEKRLQEEEKKKENEKMLETLAKLREERSRLEAERILRNREEDEIRGREEEPRNDDKLWRWQRKRKREESAEAHQTEAPKRSNMTDYCCIV